MPNENQSAPAPGSMEAEALAALEKEGADNAGKETPAKVEVKTPAAPTKEEPKKEETPKNDQPPAKEEGGDKGKKPDRTPTMIPAWKMKVLEDQKNKEVDDLKKQLEDLSKQKAPITKEQQTDLKDEIARIAKDKDVDVGLLTELADTILKRAGDSKPSGDLEKSVKKLEEERALEKELNDYNAEFSKDVLPLVAEYQLSGEALEALKSTLQDYAFSEQYAKVPLKEIFTIKQSELNLSGPKKSSEGKGPKTRQNDVVDIENMSEEEFAKLSPEKVAEFEGKKKSSSGWNTRR